MSTDDTGAGRPPERSGGITGRPGPAAGGPGANGPETGKHASGTQVTAVPNEWRPVETPGAAYRGVWIWAVFFGWLTAVGAGLVLTALVAAVTTAISFAAGVPANTPGDSIEAIGLVGGLILAAITFVAYFCGGYVAGRMARANGLWQGLAVWLWSVVVSAAAVIAGAVTRARYDILGQTGGPPQQPLDWAVLGVFGVLVAILIAAAGLVGAMLGGAVGAHRHLVLERPVLGEHRFGERPPGEHGLGEHGSGEHGAGGYRPGEYRPDEYRPDEYRPDEYRPVEHGRGDAGPDRRP